MSSETAAAPSQAHTVAECGDLGSNWQAVMVGNACKVELVHLSHSLLKATKFAVMFMNVTLTSTM